jgi:hypothetical protein
MTKIRTPKNELFFLLSPKPIYNWTGRGHLSSLFRRTSWTPVLNVALKSKGTRDRELFAISVGSKIIYHVNQGCPCAVVCTKTKIQLALKK